MPLGRTVTRIQDQDDFTGSVVTYAVPRVNASGKFITSAHGVRIVDDASSSDNGVNIVGGYSGNAIDSNLHACVIVGGGTLGAENKINYDSGLASQSALTTILGGYDNQATSSWPGTLGGAHNRLNQPATLEDVGFLGASGAGTISSSGTVVTGSSTAFTSTFNAGGGMVVLSSQSGTISSSGTAVTGSGTSFTTAAPVGTYLTDGTYCRKVTAVTSNTALTIDAAFPTGFSAASWSTAQAKIIRFIVSDTVLVVDSAFTADLSAGTTYKKFGYIYCNQYYKPNANSNHIAIPWATYSQIQNARYATIDGGTNNMIGYDPVSQAQCQADDAIILGGVNNYIAGQVVYGTGYVSTSGTAVTGVGTNFTTLFTSVGNDLINIREQGMVVASVTDDTHLTLSRALLTDVAAPAAEAGTVTSSSTTVTGTNTTFTKALIPGMCITDGSQTRKVTAIASDTSLTIATAFSPNLSAATWYVTNFNKTVSSAGLASAIVGGSGNGVHGLYNLVGGINNIVYGSKTLVAGTTNAVGTFVGASSATGAADNVLCFGSNNTVYQGALNAIVLGDTHTVGASTQNSGATYSFTAGRNHTNGGNYATCLGWRASGALTGSVNHAAGQFATVGDAIARRMTQFVKTTDATDTILTANGLAVGSSSTVDFLFLSSTAMWSARLTVLAKKQVNTDFAKWVFEVVFHRQGTFTLVSALQLTTTGWSNISISGTPTTTGAVTTGINSGGGSAWTVELKANTSSNYLEIHAVGASSTTIQWLALIDGPLTLG